ncbi:hypothetical protein U1Q18_047090, partial [Sarracenia purpurea var. burkii]
IGRLRSYHVRDTRHRHGMARCSGKQKPKEAWIVDTGNRNGVAIVVTNEIANSLIGKIKYLGHVVRGEKCELLCVIVEGKWSMGTFQFSFEHYNGVLGKMFTQSKSVLEKIIKHYFRNECVRQHCATEYMKSQRYHEVAGTDVGGAIQSSCFKDPVVVVDLQPLKRKRKQTIENL